MITLKCYLKDIKIQSLDLLITERNITINQRLLQSLQLENLLLINKSRQIANKLLKNLSKNISRNDIGLWERMHSYSHKNSKINSTFDIQSSEGELISDKYSNL